LAKIQRALVSVFDKTDLIPLCTGLAELGIELVSTGGTARAIGGAGVPVTHISDVTGFPEILDGRVKTLHPRIHGGLLARMDSDDHLAQLQEHGIVPIGLVVCNLYPFTDTIAKPGVTEPEAVEMIDIGGPCMIRAAAKNFASVTVLTSASQYDDVLSELREHDGETTPATRRRLAHAAFAHTSTYDGAIVEYLGSTG
jgi:phosphoribosylaminoimidazolecarboxamide formyltransferase/IMP cyclohydrolase